MYNVHKKKIINDNLDMLVGKRVYDKRYLKRIDRKFANKIFNNLFKLIIGGTFEDICSGYRFMKVEKFKELKFLTNNFEIETEINIFCVKKKLKYCEHEINYRERVISKSKLKTFSDGFKILFFLFKNSI